MICRLLCSSIILFFTGILLAQKPLELAKAYIEEQTENWKLTKKDISEIHLTDTYTSEHNGVTHFYFIQQYQGIEVHNAIINLNMLESGEVIFAGNRFIPNLSSKIRSVSPTISPEDAILSAALQLGVEDLKVGSLKEQLDEHTFIFEGAAISARDIEVSLKYLPLESEVRLVWAVDIDRYDSLDYWTIKVDAENAEILKQYNYTVYCQHEHHRHNGGFCKYEMPQFLPTLLNNNRSPDGASYKVFAVPLESPIHGERSTVVNPADAVASPFGWHDTNGVAGAEYTITRGNNVHAYSDAAAMNESQGDEPDGGEALVFDFFFEAGLEPDTFQTFSTTQLFYMNNVMHDFAYSYGFTEAAGSFQVNNYGRGGEEGDYIIAHAQDGALSNNASFGTPPDGTNGIMQMYTWSRSGLLTVTSPASLAGVYETSTANFGADVVNDSIFLQADVRVADDGFGAGTFACHEIENDLTGKVALVDRGECFFSIKAYNAQQAGALAVIICNYEGGNLITMGAGGSEASEVDIPVLMMNHSDCQRLRVFAEQQLNVIFTEPQDDGPSKLDGTLDNGIIAHEYGHGISNRLTGGPRNVECLNNAEQMGEGWSDYFSLVTTVPPNSDGSSGRGIGAYVREQGVEGNGIRRLPYSTSMEVNSHTYSDIVGSSGPYGTGEVWTVTLWDLYWSMVEKYGWDDDLYHGTGGNNMAIQLVMDGMKFQPCEPGFEDGRDAILAADRALYGGANQCLIWEVFARRGIGYNALQRSVGDENDGQEGFKTLPSCIQELQLSKQVTEEIRAGETIEVTLTLSNHKLEAVTEVMLTDIFAEGTSFAGFLSAEPMQHELSSDGILIQLERIESGEIVEIKYQLNTAPDLHSEAYFLDDIENGDDFWEFYPVGTQANSENVDIWQISPSRGVDGSSAWFVPATNNENDQAFQLIEPILVRGEQPVLRFYHRYQTEWGNDGGIVLVSTDGGNQWEFLDNKMLRNGYKNRLTYSTFAIPSIHGFTGEALDNFQTTYVDLNEYVGQEILVQFRFGTDGSEAGFGWSVDNIGFLDMFNYDTKACALTKEGDEACANAPEQGTIVETDELTTTEEVTPNTFETRVFPNPATNLISIEIISETRENLTWTVYTTSGQRVLQDRNNIGKGYSFFTIPVNNLAEGMYVMELRTNKQTTYQKVVIAP